MSNRSAEPPPTRDELVADIRYYDDLAQRTQIDLDRCAETDPRRRQLQNLVSQYQTSAGRCRLLLSAMGGTDAD